MIVFMAVCLLVPLLGKTASFPGVEDSPSEWDAAVRSAYGSGALADWAKEGKVTVPRQLLVRLRDKQDIESINEYLQGIRPWSHSGSSWLLHSGDYDFSLVPLTTLLYQYGDDPTRIHPRTREHLLHTLLTLEGASPGALTAPRSLGLVHETENHVLMMESSRFLKNQWMHRLYPENPRYDNHRNGMANFLSAYINSIRQEGWDEYNSLPYSAYSVGALMNLAAFADEGSVRDEARKLLETTIQRVVLSSIENKRFAPFNRQLKYHKDTSLRRDPLLSKLAVWRARVGMAADSSFFQDNLHHGAFAWAHPYQPPDALIREPEEAILVAWQNRGRGSPELYFRDGDVLLSSGGATGPFPLTHVARPITLIAAGGGDHRDNHFFIPGGRVKGGVNRTGVAWNFAVGKGLASIPLEANVLAQEGNWHLIELTDSQWLTVFASNPFSLFYLSPGGDNPEAFLQDLMQLNPSNSRLEKSFTQSSGKVIDYDLEAPPGRWVIQSEGRCPWL